MPWATSRESVEQNLMVCPGCREHARWRIYFSSVVPSSWFTVSSSHRGRTDCRSPVIVLCSHTSKPAIAIVKGEIITPIWWTRRTKTRWIKKKIRKGENISFSNRQRSRVCLSPENSTREISCTRIPFLRDQTVVSPSPGEPSNLLNLPNFYRKSLKNIRQIYRIMLENKISHNARQVAQ